MRRLLRVVSAWVFALGVVLGAVSLAIKLPEQVALAWRGVLAAAPIIVIAGALVAGIIVLLDQSHARLPRVWGLAFIWGAVASCGIALEINGISAGAVVDVLGDPAATEWSPALIGPLNEETIKGVGVALLLVMYRDTVRRPLQAFAVGGFVGLGFQMVENLTYAVNFALRDAQSDLLGAVPVVLIRGFFGFQSHWAYTALFAVGLVFVRANPPLAVASIGASYLLHFWWNAPPADNPLAIIVLIGVKCLVTIAVTGALWWWLLVQQRRWLQAAIASPYAHTLAPPAELATLATGATRRGALGYQRYYYGPQVAQVGKARQKWLLRALTTPPRSAPHPSAPPGRSPEDHRQW